MGSELETSIRSVVADVLGVGADELAPEVSLTDELAADSLDLAELAVALETELSIRLPERILDAVRTYGDLVQAARALAGTAHVPLVAPEPVDALAVCVRLVARGEDVLWRMEQLTPYVVETILEDAVHAGRGARLTISVPPDASDASLGQVHACSTGLERHGVALHVQRGPAQPPVRTLEPRRSTEVAA
jgi:acyl carrier protein